MKHPSFDFQKDQTIRVIESHTCGEPTRIIYDGFPSPEGYTMMKKKNYLEKYYDKLRSAVLCEPRGHKDMVGAILTEPVNSSSDLGVIFMDAYRWINMCGHASMGVAYSVLKTGMIQAKGEFTDVKLDTPAGTVNVSVNVSTNECRLFNVPSYLALDHCYVDIDNKPVHFRVSFGGTFFALVNLHDIDLSIDHLNIEQLVTFAKRFLMAANQKYQVKHPLEDISRIVNVEFYEKTTASDCYRNIVISEQGEIDRSPCGTGTSAELAALISSGELKQSQILHNTNFLGSTFLASVESSVNIGLYTGIVPIITGKAYVIGSSDFYLSNKDPCNDGFNIM